LACHLQVAFAATKAVGLDFCCCLRMFCGVLAFRFGSALPIWSIIVVARRVDHGVQTLRGKTCGEFDNCSNRCLHCRLPHLSCCDLELVLPPTFNFCGVRFRWLSSSWLSSWPIVN
jgi:hypothetical protein